MAEAFTQPIKITSTADHLRLKRVISPGGTILELENNPFNKTKVRNPYVNNPQNYSPDAQKYFREITQDTLKNQASGNPQRGNPSNSSKTRSTTTQSQKTATTNPNRVSPKQISETVKQVNNKPVTPKNFRPTPRTSFKLPSVPNSSKILGTGSKILGGAGLLWEGYQRTVEIGEGIQRALISGAGYLPGVSSNAAWQEAALASINLQRQRLGLPAIYPSDSAVKSGTQINNSQTSLNFTFPNGTTGKVNFPANTNYPINGNYFRDGGENYFTPKFEYTDSQGNTFRRTINLDYSSLGFTPGRIDPSANRREQRLNQDYIETFDPTTGYFIIKSYARLGFNSPDTPITIGGYNNIDWIGKYLILVQDTPEFGQQASDGTIYRNAARVIVSDSDFLDPSESLIRDGEPIPEQALRGNAFNPSGNWNELRFSGVVEPSPEQQKEDFFPNKPVPQPSSEKEKEKEKDRPEIPFFFPDGKQAPFDSSELQRSEQETPTSQTTSTSETTSPFQQQQNEIFPLPIPTLGSGKRPDELNLERKKVPTNRILPPTPADPSTPETPVKENRKVPDPTKKDIDRGTTFPNSTPDREEEKISQTPANSCTDRCSANFANKNDVKDLKDKADNNNTNINNLADALDLSLLAVINDKLGAKVDGGLSGFLTKAWKTTRADKVLNAIGTLFTIHNAAMLSRNLGQSFGDLASQTLSIFNIKDENDEAIDVNEAIDNTIEGLLTAILGAEIYGGLKESFNKANRIIGTASAAINAVRSIGDSVSALAELGAERTGKIGNALKKAGIVEDRAYEWMSENVNSSNAVKRKFEKITEGIESADSTLSSFSSAISEVKSIQDELDTFSEQKEEFKKEIKEATPKQREDNEPVKTAITESQQASESSDIQNSDFFNILE